MSAIEYEVKDVVDHRVDGTGRWYRYKVQWSGYEEHTWEPPRYLEGLQAFEEYERKRKSGFHYKSTALVRHDYEMNCKNKENMSCCCMDDCNNNKMENENKDEKEYCIECVGALPVIYYQEIDKFETDDDLLDRVYGRIEDENIRFDYYVEEDSEFGHNEGKELCFVLELIGIIGSDQERSINDIWMEYENKKKERLRIQEREMEEREKLRLEMKKIGRSIRKIPIGKSMLCDEYKRKYSKLYMMNDIKLINERGAM